MSSFRADRRAKDAGDLLEKKKKNKKERADEGVALVSTRALLKEHGYPDENIEEALGKFGPHLSRCVEYCLQQKEESAAQDVDQISDPIDEEEWARNLIQNMGYNQEVATRALEISRFSFSRALLVLLHGNDEDKTKYMGTHHFRRHTLRKTMGFDNTRAAGQNVRAEYAQRAREYSQRDMQVVDFGMHAGDTTNACFWLCLVAGLSKARWQPDAHALQGVEDVSVLWPQVRALDLIGMDRSATIRQTPFGLFAEKLRKYMCDGPHAVLLRQDMMLRLFPAFAALDP